MITHAETVLVVARKELMEHFRSKRIYIIGGLYALSFLLASLIAPRLFGDAMFSDDDQIPQLLAVYFTTFLGFTFTSLLAIILIADSICGEWKDRSLMLLFSKPVARRAVLTGKIVGAYFSLILAFASVFIVGVGILVGSLGMPDADAWGRIAGGLAFSLIGLIPFLALGTLTTVLFRTPMTSMMMSMGMKFLGFPLLSTIGVLLTFATSRNFEEPDFNSGLIFFFQHLDPDNLLDRAANIFTGSDALFFGIALGRPLEELLGFALLGIVLHSLLYFVPAYWIVGRRDYS
jgi:ABC-type transport system involved in multi-copper enzyme maturation permease subunit